MGNIKLVKQFEIKLVIFRIIMKYLSNHPISSFSKHDHGHPCWSFRMSLKIIIKIGVFEQLK